MTRTIRSLLFAEEQVKRPTGADRVEQGLEFRRWGLAGPGAPATSEQVPRGQPAPDSSYRHRPRHRGGPPIVAVRLSGADFPQWRQNWQHRGKCGRLTGPG